MGNRKFGTGLIIGVVTVSMALLSGCGQKGPLYLPDENQQQKTEKEKEKKKKAETETETENDTETSQ
ncbi:LPS translocon maturation chaperone LptM [Kaarinaea lacus]